MHLRRLTAATLASSAVIFGGSILVGQSRAQAGATPTYVCSAADRQFVATVSSNMMQLGYWSDALVHHDVAPEVVVKEAKSESTQIRATRPTDRTLRATRDVLSSMFVEYSKAVAVTARGRDAQLHLNNAWRLAHASHDLLAGAKSGLGAQGCDVTPLLGS
jgi:hypothetical protein